LAAGFSRVIVEAVEALTRRTGESYEDFVRRASNHPLARQIKLANLLDNMDAGRLAKLSTAEGTRFRVKYASALEILGETPVDESIDIDEESLIVDLAEGGIATVLSACVTKEDNRLLRCIQFHSDGPAFHTNYQRGISVCATLLTRELPAWIHPCSRLAQPCVYGCFSACSQYRELTLPAQRLSDRRWLDGHRTFMTASPATLERLARFGLRALLPIPAGGCAAPATAAALVVGTGLPQRSAPPLTLPSPDAIYAAPEPRPARGGVLMSAMTWRILHGSIR
jgi:hypothetical protein